MTENVPFNYCGLPPEFSNYKKSKVVVVPIPFDGTSSWGKGANFGPKALIDASRNMEFYDIETNSEPYKVGIFTDKNIVAKTPEEMAQKGYEKVKKLLDDGKFVVTIGGEHSISTGPIKAYAEKFNGKISVLHFDAHTDMREEYEGTKYNHACAMARAMDDCLGVVSVGIRSMDISEWDNINAKKMKGKKHDIFFAEKIYDNEKWMDKAIKLLSNKIYISIDLDVFDPSILPSTGTPEPGGLGWYTMLKFLKKVASKKNIVGFDVVELAPNPKDKASDFIAAKLIYKILAYKYQM